jgi:hypothetical protein
MRQMVEHEKIELYRYEMEGSIGSHGGNGKFFISMSYGIGSNYP